MRIGILTFHRAVNYGAYLQACALCRRLNEENSIQAEIIDFQMKKEVEKYSPERWSLLRKIKHYKLFKYSINQRSLFEHAAEDALMVISDQRIIDDSTEELVEYMNCRYDIVIVGSDEVWKIDGSRGFPNPYWLEGDCHFRRVAYAVSSRNDFSQLTPELHEKLREDINAFDLISVRDTSTYASVYDELRDKSKILLSCDPSFLYDFSVPSKTISDILGSRARLDNKKKTVVVLLDELKVAQKIYQDLHGEYNLISLSKWHRRYISPEYVTPMEWMATIANADFVITSYFHGMCFSIINNTPFLAVATAAKKEKLTDLLMNVDAGHYIEASDILANKASLLGNVRNSIERGVDYSNFLKQSRSSFNNFLNRLNQLPI